ncbi:MAG: hypothetical protein LQ352_002124 [Teloschistes flavicans]|nr:MAG: hypothetical protein LQ352_002124 [Teloschistes flavicans]
MALAVILGIVSVGMTIPGLIPPKDDHRPVVRIAAGLSSNDSANTAGNQPGLRLYDIMGRTIGSIGGKKQRINDGGFIDIKVPFDKGVGTKPAEYIQVTNGGDDALCIAYISLTQPDGTSKAWYGDVARDCGADWYHSLLTTGDDEDYQPSCVWIDGNGSYGLRFRGLGLHIHDFANTAGRAAQFNGNKTVMCDAAPRFRMYTEISDKDYIPFFNPPLQLVNGTDVDPGAVLDKSRWALPKEGPHITKAFIDQDPNGAKKRRQLQDSAFGNANSSVVIVSASPKHSAKELCESETSRGYDFVSSMEHMFCDMEAKKLWPVCNSNTTSACFDVRSSTMTRGKGLRGRDSRSGTVPPEKHYAKTVHWG